MTFEQKEICLSFNRVTFLPGSWDKRFASSVSSLAKTDGELTDTQNEWIYRLLYKYRKQIPDVYVKYASNIYCNKK